MWTVTKSDVLWQGKRLDYYKLAGVVLLCSKLILQFFFPAVLCPHIPFKACKNQTGYEFNGR